MYFSHFIDLELLVSEATGTSLVLLGRTEFCVFHFVLFSFFVNACE